MTAVANFTAWFARRRVSTARCDPHRRMVEVVAAVYIRTPGQWRQICGGANSVGG
jgi:hypothetical protein